MPSAELRNRIGLACRWLTDVALVHADGDVSTEDRRRHAHRVWKGAVRGEYKSAIGTWGFFCPVWHTGQAIKSLVMASEALGDDSLLGRANVMADFILANSVTEKDGGALILAYEDHADKVNSSAILECLDGILLLAEKTGRAELQELFLASAKWVKDNAYLPGTGLFQDLYDPETQAFIPKAYGGHEGRPLLDDGILLKAWRLSGDDAYLRVAVETADRLVADEYPAGNWVNYTPCNKEKGRLHPRHAYWWGAPMRDVFKATGDTKYLDAFRRSVGWYRQAQRRDGGLFRGTYVDFTTDSFGHATSGAACAVSMFVDYLRETGDASIIPHIENGLAFCAMMQMTTPADPNLAGVIMEKVLPPDGSDRSPYHIRDLGTIFFIQAACQWLTLQKQETSYGN